MLFSLYMAIFLYNYIIFLILLPQQINMSKKQLQMFIFIRLIVLIVMSTNSFGKIQLFSSQNSQHIFIYGNKPICMRKKHILLIPFVSLVTSKYDLHILLQHM